MIDHWTPAEKTAARVIFDRAVARARKEILDRHRDNKITELDDLWEYELEIREWRKEFHEVFQYKYSRLHLCFAICLRRGWLQVEELRGLSEERIESLKRILSF